MMHQEVRKRSCLLSELVCLHIEPASHLRINILSNMQLCLQAQPRYRLSTSLDLVKPQLIALDTRSRVPLFNFGTEAGFPTTFPAPRSSARN